MVDVLKCEMSKSDMFLLPLTHIEKCPMVRIDSYMYWNNYSIEDCLLTVQVSSEDKSEMDKFVKEGILDNRKCHVTECFDFDDTTIFIIDIAEWEFDISQFLSGNYSKMTKQAKMVIQNHHVFYTQTVKHNPVTRKVETVNKPNINSSIYAYMYPHEADKIFDNLTAMEYVIKEYDFDKEAASVIRTRGELCNIYNKKEETLFCFGQVDSDSIEA